MPRSLTRFLWLAIVVYAAWLIAIAKGEITTDVVATGPFGEMQSPYDDGPDLVFAPRDGSLAKENWDALAAQFGLPPRNKDSIIFFQAGHDFAYDSRVIYHEYTHAVVGTGRLSSRLLDDYGVSDLPRAMNEGLADYFSATLADSPTIGVYGLGRLGAALHASR